MRRLLSGVTALALFAACVASVPAEARGARAFGHYGVRSGVYGAHVYHSGVRHHGAPIGVWRGGYSGVRAGYGYGYGSSAYPAAYQDNGYGYGGWWAPLAATAVLAPLAVAAQSDYSYVSLGAYCATDARTCLMYSTAPIGTGCSCKIPGGRMRGLVE